MMINQEILERFAPKCTAPKQHVSALEAARLNSSVDSARRLAHFMGQVFVETAGFTRMTENLHYTSPERLDAVFKAVKGIEHARYLISHGERAIANCVYANRLGNRNESSGDGWRFRGSGYKQLTGRWNYEHIGKLIGVDLTADPELAREPETAARIAFAFWDANGCSAMADRGDVESITEAINGPAKLGLAERRAATLKALKIWGGA